MEKIRLVELFSGIGAQATALENLGIPFDAVCCEIDDKAYKAYCAIHGDTPNLGDITKVEHLPPCDLLTYSYPCTSVSIAGKQEGMAEGSGTESSLVWEVGRLLADAKARGCLPEYLVMENVDAVLHSKNKAVFEKWVAGLTDLGYESSYAILNAKDYGVPQNRRRCFMVSTLNHGRFKFPPKVTLTRTLGDMLEKEVDESYYLSEEKIAKYESHRERNRAAGRGFGWKPVTLDDIMSTIMTNPTKDRTNTVIEARLIRAGTLADTYDQDSRVYSTKGLAPTMRTGGTPTPIEEDAEMGYRIRYLTPKECWRLQGFDDARIDRAKSVIDSDNALYKMAGNSIAVPCLEAIFKGMFLDNTYSKAQKKIVEW